MIKAVLFDIDDTLLDFEAYVQNAMRDGFQKFGLRAYGDGMYRIFQRINTALWHEIEQGSLTFEQLLQTRWNRIFAELDIAFDGCVFEQFFRDSLFGSAIPVDGAHEILAYLQNRYILCVASNGPYAQQVNRLRQGNMLHCFSHLFISEKIGASKPSAQFFSFCLSELNARHEETVSAGEVLMVGDSLASDMVGAIDSGLKTCFFDKHKTGVTNGLPLDHIVVSLDEIRKIL